MTSPRLINPTLSTPETTRPGQFHTIRDATAWNIALFPDARDREHHVEATVDLIVREAAIGPDPPPPGFRQGFADELLWLVEAKRDLFPWQLATIAEAWLQPELRPGTAVLAVDADGAVERTELALGPSVMGAHIIAKAVAGMHRDTRAQRGTLEDAARTTPELLRQAVTRDMATAYCAQRGDLRGYHRMLRTWQEEVRGDGELRAGLGRFLLAVEEIEADTKVVLGLLAAALGVPWEER